MQIAKRLEPLKGFFIMEMNIRMGKMKQEGRDVINLGVGDPDFAPPDHLLQTLQEAVGHPEYHHYPSFYPIQPLKNAIAGWYKRRFGVDLDPNSEVLPLLGSTDALFMVHLCLIDPGDIGLVPDPSYSSYPACVQLAGGLVEKVPFIPITPREQRRRRTFSKNSSPGPRLMMWPWFRTTPIPRFTSTTNAR
jgi:LL-diaminopimelate aminotransferase